MNNISNIHDCYGCGVCATSCSRKIIEIELNSDGFYEPFITNKSKCTECGICRAVCAYLYDELSLKDFIIKPYAAWSKDYAVQRKCSSGGVGFEIGRALLNQGYKVCAVRYNATDNKAEHYIATTIEELIPSIGSKYIQSYTIDGFKAINKKEKYLVTGTPCQMDSFRRYIQKFHCENNFILLDFFCHGVPSKLMWDKYVSYVEKKVGKLTYVSWRNKFTGWHDSWAMAIDGAEHGEPLNWHNSYDYLISEKKSFLNSRLSQNDMFYSLFLSDACLGKACYEKCKYKYNRSSADIRIGDLWGSIYKDNEDGVSATVAYTKKGDEILHHCNCELVEHTFDVVSESQMVKCPLKGKLYYKLIPMLKNRSQTIESIYKTLLAYKKRQHQINRVMHPLRTINNLVKKIIR